VLIIVYLTIALLTFSGFKPISVYTAIIGICYLPGFVILSLFRKGSLKFDDLILSFPVSVGAGSVLLLVFLYAGLPVRYVIHFMFGIIGISLVIRFILYRRPPSLTISLTSSEKRFIIVAVIMTLLFSIPLLSETITISAHGFHHSSIATQILNGFYPPENPGLGGFSLSYHWGFHAYLAAISSPSGLPPLRVISLLNIMSLFFVFCLAYRSASHLDLPEGYRYLVPLALIGLMRSDSIFFLFNKLFSLNITSLRDITFPEARPSEILQSWIWGGGAPWFDRRLFFMNKFYNANTMPLGIILCLSYFLFLLVYLKRTYELNSPAAYPVILSLIILASCFIYPPLAIIPLLHAPLWAGFLILSNLTDIKKGLRESLRIIMPYGLSVLVVLPYLLSVAGITGGPAIKINVYDQSIINLVTFWLPLPFIFIGAVFSFRKLSRDVFLFLIGAALLCFGLATFTQITFNNSAKFTFILSYFYAILFVVAISELLRLFSRRLLRVALCLCIILFLLITPVITVAAYIISPWFTDQTYTFSQGHIVFNKNRKRNEAYVWIRGNTPPEALVMLTYTDTSNPYTIAQNSTYEAAAITERNLFVVNDWYTYTNREYINRIKIRKKALSDSNDTGVSRYFKSLNRPVYLLVEEKLPSLYFTDDIFNNFPDNPEGFKLVFSNKRQRVYLKRE
jgi:hypothetical protein